MGHHHDKHHQDHHHHHHGSDSNTQQTQPLSFREKAQKLLDHWIHHNEDHAAGYQRWAEEFRGNGLSKAAELLESAIELTSQINHVLRQAESTIESADE